MSSSQPEYWLRGPIKDISPYLQPAAYALLQARMEVTGALENFPETKLWEKPAGVASIAFHLQHLAGVLDRLFTYAKGVQLNQQQLDFLAAEGKENTTIHLLDLLDQFIKQVDKALEQLQNTNENSILEKRGVGRKQIPSNVIGIIFHAAEHTQRHTGQLLVTAKMLSGQSR